MTGMEALMWGVGVALVVLLVWLMNPPKYRYQEREDACVERKIARHLLRRWR